MELVFIVARSQDDSYDEFLGASLSKIPGQRIHVGDKTDTVISTAKKYNTGVKVAKDKGIITNDSIVVFVKNNVFINDTQLPEKLSFLFNEKPNISVVGVMGARELHIGENLYAEKNQPVNGIIYAVDKDKGEYIEYTKKGLYDVVALDDSLIAVRGSQLVSMGDWNLFDFEVDKGFGVEIAIKSRRDGNNVVAADLGVISEDSTDIDGGVMTDLIKHQGFNDTVTIDNITVKVDINSVVDVEL